jgi:hypothetical protein
LVIFLVQSHRIFPWQREVCDKVFVNEICHEVVDSGACCVSAVWSSQRRRTQLTRWVETVVDVAVFKLDHRHAICFPTINLQKEDLFCLGSPIGAGLFRHFVTDAAILCQAVYSNSFSGL